ncbi:hypothetical protein Sbs19_11170 [Sphingobium sp. BS19]|nr:hypothetical protein Sbs19_11170 [Sphingobium sp. BS19]
MLQSHLKASPFLNLSFTGFAHLRNLGAARVKVMLSGNSGLGAIGFGPKLVFTRKQ